MFANNQMLGCTESYQHALKPSSAKRFGRSNEPTSSWWRLGLQGIYDSMILEYLTFKEYFMSKNLCNASENSEVSNPFHPFGKSLREILLAQLTSFSSEHICLSSIHNLNPVFRSSKR